MTLDYTKVGSVKIYIIEYVGKCLKELPKDMDWITTTPAIDNLFIINIDSSALDKESAAYFYSRVAQILFLGK